MIITILNRQMAKGIQCISFTDVMMWIVYQVRRAFELAQVDGANSHLAQAAGHTAMGTGNNGSVGCFSEKCKSYLNKESKNFSADYLYVRFLRKRLQQCTLSRFASRNKFIRHWESQSVRILTSSGRIAYWSYDFHFANDAKQCA